LLFSRETLTSGKTLAHGAIERRHDVEEVIEMRTPVFTEPAQSGLLADIYESPGGDAYTIEIPVPGLKPDEIVLQADTYGLTVSTEPTQTEPKSGRKYIQREYSVRPMSRIFNFPVEIDTDNVQATLTNGILQIRVRKAAAGKRKIIRVGQAA
jgi:HSP20 family protein